MRVKFRMETAAESERHCGTQATDEGKQKA